jgi:hypothetical protein
MSGREQRSTMTQVAYHFRPKTRVVGAVKVKNIRNVLKKI